MLSYVVTYRASDGLDAIDEYSRRLVDALRARRDDAEYVSDGMASARRSGDRAAWIFLQYQPFNYGRWGFAPGLVRHALAMRLRSGPRLAVMVHEAWMPMDNWRTTLMGLYQRAQLRSLLGFADVTLTSTQALADEIGGGAIHMPVASTVTPIATTPRAARARLGLDDRLVVALFGGAHPGRALEYAETAIDRLAGDRGANGFLVLNLGADAPPVGAGSGVEVLTPGRLAAEELSLRLWASDLVLLPFVDGVSTRRTTLMAALAHARPVLALRGYNTDQVLLDRRDSLMLTPTGDADRFAQAAVALAGDRDRLRAIGSAGHRLYTEEFDWPALARRVAAALKTGSSTGRFEVAGARA